MTKHKDTGVASVQIDGKTLFAGLLWQPPTPKASRSATVHNGKAGGFSMHLTRQLSSGVQVGYLRAAQSIENGYSLAEVLARTIELDNWIGVFQLEESRYALVAVHGGAIMAGRDRIGSRAEIEGEFKATLSLVESAGGNWSAIYAPSDFGLDALEASLGQLISRASFKSAARLKSFEIRVNFWQIAIGVAVIGAGVIFGGFMWLHGHSMSDNAPVSSPVRIKVAPPHPWKLQASMAAQLDIWDRALVEIPMYVAGWKAGSVKLEQDNVLISYARNGLPVKTFLASATRHMHQHVEVTKGGDEAQISKPLQAKTSEDENILSSSAIILEITSYFQGLNLPVPVFKKLAVSLPPAKIGQEWKEPDWQAYEWTMDSDLSPRALFYGKKFPGMRITSVVLSQEGDHQNWKISGIVYAKS